MLYLIYGLHDENVDKVDTFIHDDWVVTMQDGDFIMVVFMVCIVIHYAKIYTKS